MQEVIERGLNKEGILPGGLGVRRKAHEYYQKAKLAGGAFKERLLLSAFALAVAEENASGEIVVTAPTCGSSGILPAVLYYLKTKDMANDENIVKALATAGLIGNLVKYNASISGAEVGCQGEVGTACSMAAGAMTQILGGNIYQIEYAAEMALEHHLGLTCDPVKGMVQIPCIERNVFAANRAVDCANYALFSDGKHLISFDKVVKVMKKTGHDLPYLYKETAKGGLAEEYEKT
jgi:L-serine dehydratase